MVEKERTATNAVKPKNINLEDQIQISFEHLTHHPTQGNGRRHAIDGSHRPLLFGVCFYRGDSSLQILQEAFGDY